MKIKHFMDIQRIREQADEGTASNIGGFSVGDHIVIQEKVDGANASIRYAPLPSSARQTVTAE